MFYTKYHNSLGTNSNLLLTTFSVSLVKNLKFWDILSKIDKWPENITENLWL